MTLSREGGRKAKEREGGEGQPARQPATAAPRCAAWALLIVLTPLCHSRNMAAAEVEARFRLADGVDIGPLRFPLATTVLKVKETLLAEARACSLLQEGTQD